MRSLNDLFSWNFTVDPYFSVTLFGYQLEIETFVETQSVVDFSGWARYYRSQSGLTFTVGLILLPILGFGLTAYLTKNSDVTELSLEEEAELERRLEGFDAHVDSMLEQTTEKQKPATKKKASRKKATKKAK